MLRVRSIGMSLTLIFTVFMTTARADAQAVSYLGTVLEVEASRVLIGVVNEKSHQENRLWFAIDRSTRIMRGDRNVSFPDAQIGKGERVTDLADPAATTKMLAREIRLADTPPSQAQTSPPPPAPAGAHTAHQQPAEEGLDGMPPGAAPSGWHFMQDGVVAALFNHQGGPRGGDEFVVPNWWMGMWMRQGAAQRFGVSAMLSLDAATVGKSGYREIFQVGEAFEGKPLIDRQHPHDFVMQLAASWQVAWSDHASIIIAGGPAGEPTLGPVAFMHRASAAGLALAPLGHHTFDSTHISFGVVSAAVERGRWTIEGSMFNGREPDEHRWDFDLGAWDSAAGRVWFRPTDEWAVQVSTGRLREPEELVEGDAVRTTASASWLRTNEPGFSAFTAGYGVHAAHGGRRHGFFGEFTRERGPHSLSGRAEFQQVETHVLLTGDIPEAGPIDEEPATVVAVTVGGARRLAVWRGFEGTLGAQVTFHGVPETLQMTHGDHPVSAQAFFRLRLPGGSMGRMWNMRMSQGHRMAHTR